MNAWHDRPWLRRALFLAVNLVAGVVLVTLFLMPIHAFFAERDTRIADQRVLLARLNAIAAQEPRVQAIARQIDAQADRGEFLVGPNEGVTSADLQTRLKAIAETTGARLRSVQASPPRTVDQVRYIGARIDFSGSLQAIHRVIHTVESGKPYLFVTNAVIKVQPPVTFEGPPLEPVIEAQLEIFGAVQLEGGSR